MSEPHAKECSNPGHDDRWTCPGCYSDMSTKRAGRFTCDYCGRLIDCRLSSQPVCVAEIVSPEDDEDA